MCVLTVRRKKNNQVGFFGSLDFSNELRGLGAMPSGKRKGTQLKRGTMNCVPFYLPSAAINPTMVISKSKLLMLNFMATCEPDNVRDHRAGTSDQPLQNHAQVRLRVHHIVMCRFWRIVQWWNRIQSRQIRSQARRHHTSVPRQDPSPPRTEDPSNALRVLHVQFHKR